MGVNSLATSPARDHTANSDAPRVLVYLHQQVLDWEPRFIGPCARS